MADPVPARLRRLGGNSRHRSPPPLRLRLTPRFVALKRQSRALLDRSRRRPTPSRPTTTAPETATIADPATADPCSLLDIEPVKSVGTTTLDPDNVLFAGCRGDLKRPNGGDVRSTIAFENQLRVLADRRWHSLGGVLYTVVRYPLGDGFCKQQWISDADRAAMVAAVARPPVRSGLIEDRAVAASR
jgi:hypothetical protein